VWADHLTFEGAYVSLMSGEGQLALSYYPFEGATAMGTAGGSRVSVVLPDQRKVTLLSQTDFLPGETRATVYGRFIPDRRGPGVRMMNADREDEFQKALQQ
jgi:hypothetical protein